jgi:hypothetical protein
MLLVGVALFPSDCFPIYGAFLQLVIDIHRPVQARKPLSKLNNHIPG